ncbi:MAG: hypothetical protein IPJ13_13930 [Saprospiraceae bacterium]|nr:hypothetical protein [Saprospiraceae bacterium]
MVATGEMEALKKYQQITPSGIQGDAVNQRAWVQKSEADMERNGHYIRW